MARLARVEVFAPNEIVSNGIDSLLLGATAQLAQEIDNQGCEILGYQEMAILEIELGNWQMAEKWTMQLIESARRVYDP